MLELSASDTSMRCILRSPHASPAPHSSTRLLTPLPGSTLLPGSSPPPPPLAEMDPKNREAWFTLGYALKEQGNIKEGEIALLQAIQLDREGRGHLPIWKLIAHAKQGLGNHRGAVKVATEALKRAQELVRVGLLKREQMGELMMLRGACNHALGQFKSAQEDYSAVWKMDQTGMSGESAQLR